MCEREEKFHEQVRICGVGEGTGRCNFVENGVVLAKANGRLVEIFRKWFCCRVYYYSESWYSGYAAVYR